jgi:peptidoglycan L-alanyl-D-glutamate endopeptidase CwlK
MSRALKDLHPAMYPKVCELIAIAAEHGIAVMIVFTGRTQQEQDDLFAQGRTKPGAIVTWTRDSKHVMKAPDFKARAVDLCLYDQYELHGPDKLKWDEKDPAWQELGKIGESVGLKWGVFLASAPTKRTDIGHFELQ